MSAYERLAVDAPSAAVVAVVAALRSERSARAITEYAAVDHGHDMAAGAPPTLAWTLVFGNPGGQGRGCSRTSPRLPSRFPCARS